MCLMVVVWAVLHVLLSFSDFVKNPRSGLETSYNIESQVAPNPKGQKSTLAAFRISHSFQEDRAKVTPSCR